MKKITFEQLALAPELLEAVKNAGYETPSPIQAQAIPEILAGRDIFGCAQTGTGKTAAFVLPIMQRLSASPNFVGNGEFRALIMVPTRELAEQVATMVGLYGKFLNLVHCKVYGGVSQKPQVKMLSEGVDILIATPGRLMDLYNQRKLKFSAVKYLVLDEADRMLDMGFIRDIKKICSLLPKDRQSLLFSATLDKHVEELAASIVNDPKRISIQSDSPMADKIEQKLYFATKDKKYELLQEILKDRLQKDPDALTLVFCRTKHGANKLAKNLTRDGLNADAIHGNKTQAARQNSLNKFKGREISILAATDIAARGIDVKDMSLVVNYDMPEDPETYVHRIGRTARAEASGEAVSFSSPEEMGLTRAVERFIKRKIPQANENPNPKSRDEDFDNPRRSGRGAMRSNGGGMRADRGGRGNFGRDNFRRGGNERKFNSEKFDNSDRNNSRGNSSSRGKDDRVNARRADGFARTDDRPARAPRSEGGFARNSNIRTNGGENSRGNAPREDRAPRNSRSTKPSSGDFRPARSGDKSARGGRNSAVSFNPRGSKSSAPKANGGWLKSIRSKIFRSKKQG